jgi:hypothetical protein
MVQFMKDNFKKEKSMVTENIVGKMDQFTEVHGKIIQSVVKVNIYGQMVENTLEIG